MFKDRCKKLLTAARESSMDSILITSPINMRYFSGFTGDDGCLLISANKLILFTDFRYTIQAQQQTNGLFEIREIQGRVNGEIIGKELERQECIYCGYEETFMTVFDYVRYKKMPCEIGGASQLIAKIRTVKSPAEIENLIAAQKIADSAFSELLRFLTPGMTEKEVANELEYLMKKLGAECPSFDTIIASGPNGALCHAVPTSRKLTGGDMVVMDFGCKYNGYCSDMTRTIAIGEPCEELKKIYRVVKEAQALSLRAVKAGMECRKLDAIARTCIDAKGYAGKFGHSLGHGFGLEVHEAPNASMYSDWVLLPNMTITVEPGIYIENLGGVRIEDCVIVTETGHINPVTTTKDLIVIE